MGDDTKIQWTDATWNPIRGCSRVSAGCDNCYAMNVAHRFSGPGLPYEGLTTLRKGKADWAGIARMVPEHLSDPLRWRKPRRIFVNSMSDLFHHSITNEEIAAVFGVMAACPQHTFQILTKRPERMVEWFGRDGAAAQVDLFKHVALAGRIQEMFSPEREAAVAGFPGYFVTSKGRVLTDNGSESCLLCGKPNEATIARKKFCSKECASKAGYERRMGRWSEPAARVEMKPMVADAGHSRVMLYREDGSAERPLIHRLALEAFDRPGRDGEQGCHIDGDATNNALWNLRWGTQSENWDDRKRHGNARSWSKISEDEARDIRESYRRGLSAGQIANSALFLGRITETQVRHIVDGEQWREHVEPEWPLPQVWLGVSAENQATADERIPLLSQTPAAVRFVSAEPLIGDIDLRKWFDPWTCGDCEHHGCEDDSGPTRCDDCGEDAVDDAASGSGRCPKCGKDDGTSDAVALSCPRCGGSRAWKRDYGFKFASEYPGIDWVIVGGESGPGARPCDVEWIRSIVAQCKDAGTKVFVKQLGTSFAIQQRDWCTARRHDRKGGDITEWPEDLRVREFPEVSHD